MPSAVHELRDIPTSARKKLPKADFAGPDESFPIAEPKDVAAAAKLYGKAKNPDAVKAKIISIAKRKGPAFTAKLPKAWQDSSMKHAGAKDASLSPFISQIHLAAAVENQPRTGWAQLLRTGKFYDPRYGDFTITRADLATMAANFATKYPKDPTRLAIDYNHGTSRPSSSEEGKAAGWLTDVQLRAQGDELWGQVEWTEQAASMIDAKEYQFVSATFSMDYTNSNGGEDLGPTLLAAAVTNRPVVHGMAPLALAQSGAVRLADASDAVDDNDDETAEQLFSFDEQRRRIQAALTAVFGLPYGYGPSDYFMPSRGVCLQDLFDDVAIYCEYDGSKFSVGYAIAADGTVTFTSDPVEVRVTYEPLTAPDAEEQSMSTIKVKDAKGAEIELAQETVAALVKAYAPAEPVELAALKQTLETQGTKIVDLQTRNAALELAAKTEKATRAVDVLVREGKLDPKDKDSWHKLAMSDEATFTSLAATLAKKREIDTTTGSSGEPAQGAGELDAAIAEVMKDNPKLTKQQAYALALDKNPKLYELVSRA